MAFCSKCGAQLAANAAFCANCGQSQGSAPAVAGSQPGLAENVAGALCYCLGWLTGLIFLLVDKRPSVQFHAAQSLVTFGGLHIIRLILGMTFGYGFVFGGMMGWTQLSAGLVILKLLGLYTFIIWILCMVKAYQGERFKLPVVGDIAEGLAGK